MNLSPNEIHVLSVLHHYEAELEKIAKSGSIRKVFTPADLRSKILALQKKQKAVKSELGWSGLNPFSSSRAARTGALGRYQKDIDKYQRMLDKRLSLAKQYMAEGRNLDAARAEIRAQQARPKITKDLEPDAPGAPPKTKKPGEEPEHWLKTDAGRRAALLGTGTAVGAAGLYAGQKYLQERNQGGGGYGGY